jgi:hypothetical protein
MEEMIPEKTDFDQHTWGRCHGKGGEAVLEPENPIWQYPLCRFSD